MRALYDPLIRYFSRAVRDRTEAEDLAQDVCVRILRRGELETLDHFTAYVFQVADSVLKDRHRRRVVRHSDHEAVFDPETYRDPSPGPEQQLLARDALRTTSILLAQLPERARAVFVLRRLDGLSFAEIARRLGISVSAVEKNMARATRHLIAGARADQ